jgi:hypothetical protein
LNTPWYAAALQVKQSKCRSGYSDLDAAQLEAKEQEAARAAAELLEQLEKEEAAKTAKAAKKKKKGAQQQRWWCCGGILSGARLQEQAEGCSCRHRPAHPANQQVQDLLLCLVQECSMSTVAAARTDSHTLYAHAAIGCSCFLACHLPHSAVLFVLCIVGKGKAATADCAASDTTETPQQEAVADMLPPEPANGVHQQQQHTTPSRQRQHCHHPSSLHDSAATGASWPAQDLHDASTPADPGDSAASKAADGKHQPRKQAKQAASTSPGGSSKQAGADVVTISSSSHEPQQEQQHNLAHAVTDDTASSVDEASVATAADAVDDELDVLRREWEALLEQAARCKEQRQQPTMLAK